MTRATTAWYAQTMTTIPTDRYDASALRAPVTLDTGARRCEVVIATPGPQSYPWGVEVVTPKALQDKRFIDGLAGVPLLWSRQDAKHPKRKVRVGDDGGAERVGTVLSARWDADFEGIGAVIATVVLDTPAGFEAIRAGMHSVSPRYEVDLDPTRTQQIGRYDVNHVVVTNTPRSQRAPGRFDAQEGPLDDEDLKKIGLLLDEKIKPIQSRLDAAEAKLSTPEAPRQDAAGDWLDVVEAAGFKGLTLDRKAGLAACRKQVVTAISPDRADTVDHATAIAMFVDAARSAPVRGNGLDRLRDGSKLNARSDARNHDDADDFGGTGV